MKFVKVNGLNEDFFILSKKLEDFQYSLMPILKDKGYNLTDGLQDIVGYVLYIDNQPIGSIGLKKVSDDICEIVRVFVCQEYRGNAYAKLLFEKIENLAKTLGYKKAVMEVWTKATSALALYKKLGYSFSEEKNSEWFNGLKYVEIYKTL